MKASRNTLTSLYMVFAVLASIVIISSCDNEVDIPDGALEEQVVNISGLWSVGAVSLNGTDITDRFDFQNMTLKLEMSNGEPTTYEIDNNGTPFVITEDGTWSYDDKIYPQQVEFSGGGKSESVRFAIPPISGDERFTIEFSLGCEDNKYTYQMVRQ